MLQLAVAAPDDLEGLKRPPTLAVAATPAFFRGLGIAMVRGRAFNDGDTVSGAPVVILSEMTARRMFGSVDVIGRSIAIAAATDSGWPQIVGVARDTDVRFIYADRQPLIYVPFAQQPATAVPIVARSTGGGARAVPALREAIRKADPDLSVDAIGTGRPSHRPVRAAAVGGHGDAVSRRLHAAVVDGRACSACSRTSCRIARAKSVCACRWAPARGRSS